MVASRFSDGDDLVCVFLFLFWYQLGMDENESLNLSDNHLLAS